MIYRCIVIEDEPLAAKKMEGFISEHPALNHVDTFSNPVKALQFIGEFDVDVIFLDVQMKQMTGIEFLKTVNTSAKIILTTAHSKYAIEGYELQVSDYLLKPFSFSRFLKSIEKVKAELESNSMVDFIFIKTEYHAMKVMTDDILFIKGMRDYLHVITSTQKIMTLDTFSSYEDKLPSQQFARVHRSYMVALSKIEKIERNRIYIGEEVIPIGEAYKEALLNRLNL